MMQAAILKAPTNSTEGARVPLPGGSRYPDGIYDISTHLDPFWFGLFHAGG